MSKHDYKYNSKARAEGLIMIIAKIHTEILLLIIVLLRQAEVRRQMIRVIKARIQKTNMRDTAKVKWKYLRKRLRIYIMQNDWQDFVVNECP